MGGKVIIFIFYVYVSFSVIRFLLLNPRKYILFRAHMKETQLRFASMSFYFIADKTLAPSQQKKLELLAVPWRESRGL